LIVGRQIITPMDLEQTYGLSGGHAHHGEQSLDQFFTFRPIIGWAQYRTPIKGLYLCGAARIQAVVSPGRRERMPRARFIKDFRKAG